MDAKPTKGLKVKVNAKREAVFGDDSVAVKRVEIPEGKARSGVLTGTTLAGYCEVEMPSLDLKKHWYPTEDLKGEKGEDIVEEEVQIDMPEEEADDDAEE